MKKGTNGSGSGQEFFDLFSSSKTAERVSQRNRKSEEKGKALSTAIQMVTTVYRSALEQDQERNIDKVDKKLKQELLKLVTREKALEILERGKEQVLKTDSLPVSEPELVTEVVVDGDVTTSEEVVEELKEKFPMMKHLAGQPELKAILDELIMQIKHPEVFEEYGVEVPNCFLFHGPPGTGKTFSVKILANEAGTDFMSVKASELMSKFVGEGSQNVGAIFDEAAERAKKHPSGHCILFVDEIENLLKERGGGDAGSDANDQIVTEFLQNLDGFSKKPGVILIGATNRRDILDSAYISRIQEEVLVDLPDLEGIKAIFKVHQDIAEEKTENQVFEGPVEFSLVEELYKKGCRISGRDIEKILRNVRRRKALEVVRKRRAQEDCENLMVTQEEIEEGIKKYMQVPEEDDQTSLMKDLWGGFGNAEELEPIEELPLKEDASEEELLDDESKKED